MDVRNDTDVRHDDKNTCAILISGRDTRDVNFAPTCLKDVCMMRDILSESVGVIDKSNVSCITPYKNNTKSQIEKIYQAIVLRKPEKLFLYYSGHSMSTIESDPFLDIGDNQGDALNASRMKNFIRELLPKCTQVLFIFDCCSAAKFLFLPELPPGFMPNHRHIQWCSSKRSGISYLFSERSSMFTSYIISGLKCGRECPNGDENCPFCRKLGRSISPDNCISVAHLSEYVNGHMETRVGVQFSFCDLPLLMINPEARE